MNEVPINPPPDEPRLAADSPGRATKTPAELGMQAHSSDQSCPFSVGLTAKMTAELAADLAALEAAGALIPPDDPDGLDGPRFLDDEELYDDLPPMSRVEALEWELWAGVDQDEAEREMLRRRAPAWVWLPPGGDLAAALEPVRPGVESPVALIELMKAAARMEAWAASIKAAAIASFVRQRKTQLDQVPRPSQVDAGGRPVDPERSWTAEIGAALHLSAQTATRHIETALHLTGTLAATHTALRCGVLSWSKALSISEATRQLSAEAARAVEQHVLRRAPGQTHRNLAASLRRQVAKYTAADEADRHRAAVAERTCKLVPLPDGMAGLWVVHTADKIQQIWIAIQAMADLAKRPTGTTATGDGAATATGSTTNPPSNPTSSTTSSTGSLTSPASSPSRSLDGLLASSPDGSPEGSADGGADRGLDEGCAGSSGGLGRDGRLAPQRRADVVADLFEHLLHNGLDWLGRRLPDSHRRRPHIEVLVPITTLLGMNDDPCELTGYGPIPADQARHIATAGTWRRLLTDPATGTVLEAATTRHDPPTAVTETLLARHPTCAWPGCNRTSRDCDRDHATPYRHTHTTTLTGLVPYCEYHHLIKDTPAWGWTTTTHPNGTVTLTTPTGHRYTTVPPTRGPIATPPATAVTTPAATTPAATPAATPANPPAPEPPPF